MNKISGSYPLEFGSKASRGMDKTIKETIEINYYSRIDFPKLGSIIKKDGKKYRVVDNSVRNITTAELV